MLERSKTGAGSVSFVFRRGNESAHAQTDPHAHRRCGARRAGCRQRGAPRPSTSTGRASRRSRPRSRRTTRSPGRTGTRVNHQVLATKGEFVSPILKPGKSFSFTFTAAGTYSYRDELHPKLTGSDHRQGAAADPHARRLRACHHRRRQGDAERRRLEPQGRRDGRHLLPAVSAAEPDPARDDPDHHGGAFSFIVAPGMLTTYEASWKGALLDADDRAGACRGSSLGRNNGWVVHASASRPFAGRSVQIQRLNTSTGQWVTLRKVQLDSQSTARVPAEAARRASSRLRVTMSVNQAGAGYLGVIGPTVTWRPPATRARRGRQPPRARRTCAPTSSQLTTSHHAVR